MLAQVSVSESTVLWLCYPAGDSKIIVTKQIQSSDLKSHPADYITLTVTQQIQYFNLKSYPSGYRTPIVEIYFEALHPKFDSEKSNTFLNTRKAQGCKPFTFNPVFTLGFYSSKKKSSQILSLKLDSQDRKPCSGFLRMLYKLYIKLKFL